MTRKAGDRDRLSKIDEAIDDSIIDSSEKDLREEFADQGDSFEKAVARVASIFERAKASAAKVRLEEAQREMKEFYERSNVRTLDLAKARRRLDGMMAGAADTMIAARKGSKLSERDQDGVVDDLAQLEALENEEREGKE
jgi:hypothetical protein